MNYFTQGLKRLYFCSLAATIISLNHITLSELLVTLQTSTLIEARTLIAGNDNSIAEAEERVRTTFEYFDQVQLC